MRWATLTAALSLCAMAATAVWADPPRAGASDVASGAPIAPPSSPVSTPTAFSVTSTQGQTDASVKASFGLPFVSPENQETNSYSLTISTPVTKGQAGTTNLATLDGFADSTSLEIQYNHFDIFTDNAGVLSDIDACRADELQAMADAIEFLKLDDQAEAAALASTKLAAMKAGEGTCVDWVLNPVQFKQQTGLDISKAPKRLQQELAAWSADVKSANKQRIQGLALVYGLTGKVGYDQHIWYDGSSLAKSDQTRIPASAGVFFTYVAPGWNWAVTAQFKYQRAYMDGKTKVLCPHGTGVVTCINGFIGAPKETDMQLLSLEIRDRLPIPKWVGGSSIGFAPMASYDFHTGAYAFALPIYLFGDGKSLNGGVSVNWSSLTHNTVVGVFLTQPFSVPGQGAPAL